MEESASYDKPCNDLLVCVLIAMNCIKILSNSMCAQLMKACRRRAKETMQNIAVRDKYLVEVHQVDHNM